MKQWSYEQVIEYLDGISQYTAGTGVARGKCILSALQHPEKGMQIIHVAGTNGKGSVCAYLESMLRACGYKTGMFTSPHLMDIRERILVNKELVGKEQFTEAFQEVYRALSDIRKENAAFELAYFDYLLAMAFCIYRQEQPDFIIMETGLGGRLDASNAVDKPILSVLTTIGLEHQAILGDTIEAIAREKAGIIKEGIPVVYWDGHKDSTRVFEEKVLQCNGSTKDAQGSALAVAVSGKDYEILKNTGKVIDFSLHNEYYKNDCFSVQSAAPYQVMNGAIALTAMGVLRERGFIFCTEEQLRQGMMQMHWSGRMEEILPQVYVDGAHNPQGIESFVEAVEEICKESPQVTGATLLFSVVSDKDYEKMIDLLGTCHRFQEVLVTQTGGKRQLSKEKIAACFSHKGNIQVREFDEAMDALEYGLENRNGFLFCAGSLYLAGDIRRYMNDKGIQ